MMWSLKNLEKFLTENGVDVSTWGKGEAKTLNHLLIELVKGECGIKVEEGKVIRIVNALSINVLYKDEILKEEYQQFKDGRIRRRRMDCSVAEKITNDEISDLVTAVKRGISEELQIRDISSDQIEELSEQHRKRASGSYPGTYMNMVLYKFNVNLKYHQYNPHGYIERQKDKNTHFIWVRKKELRKWGWISEGKLNSDLKSLISISHEMKNITHILTDCDLDFQLFDQSDHVNGDYLVGYIQKFKGKFGENISDDKLECIGEFKDRVEEICHKWGFNALWTRPNTSSLTDNRTSYIWNTTSMLIVTKFDKINRDPLLKGGGLNFYRIRNNLYGNLINTNQYIFSDR